ncbi:MAG: glycosyltransferase family 4 protein [Bergeyella sp.]|nr:glycosyltransferase family 4 protein [Bergeyella sp.]
MGVVTLSKGFDRFCALSSYFSEKGEDRFVSVVVGRHGLDPENYPKVNFVAKKNTYLSRKEFNEGVEKLDFILFFYDNEQYRLTASGAIFDAIEHEKVIIAIRNDYFEEIFQKCGDLGFLCKDDTEVFEIVNKILGNELDYSHVYENIRRAKEIYDYRNQIILL